MNEEKVKRGRGRPLGGISHVGISTSELAKYCADHPNDTVMVSRVFWEKNGLITSGVSAPKEDVELPIIETNGQVRVLGDMFGQTLPVNAPQIEMSLTE